MATRFSSALLTGAVATTAVFGSTILTTESASAFTVFTDRTAWRAASGFQGGVGLYDLVEDFSSAKLDQAQSITFGSGITSTLIQASYDSSFDNKVPANNAAQREYLGKTGASTSIEWAFPDPISAFGFDIQGGGNNSGTTITGFFNGKDQPEVTISIEDTFVNAGNNNNSYAFFGVVGMGLFDGFTFGSPAVNNFRIDNVEAVPTPALLPGLIGFGISILRKRKKQGGLLATV